MIAGCGLGLLVSQLNNYTLAPITEERVSEAAGVNSAGGSFGLSFGLAFAGAIMLASLSFMFTDHGRGQHGPPAGRQGAGRRRARGRRGGDEQHRSSRSCSPSEPEEVQDEIIRINTEARPEALQVALLVPLLAAVLGLVNAFRMVRTPEPKPSGGGGGDAARLT